MGADLRCHSAGDFRHRHEKRQRALPGGYSFVGDRSHAARHQLLGLRSIRRQMQIGEEYLPARQFFALRREWLLYLHDQFGAAEYSVAIRRDLGPSALIIGVCESCTRSCASLDHDLMPLVGELTHSRGHNADAVFVVFDLPWHTDQHGNSRRLTIEFYCRLLLTMRSPFDLARISPSTSAVRQGRAIRQYQRLL